MGKEVLLTIPTITQVAGGGAGFEPRLYVSRVLALHQSVLHPHNTDSQPFPQLRLLTISLHPNLLQ